MLCPQCFHVFLFIYIYGYILNNSVTYLPMAMSPGINNKQFKSKGYIFLVFVVPELSSEPDSIRCSTCWLSKCLMPQSQEENPFIYSILRQIQPRSRKEFISLNSYYPGLNTCVNRGQTVEKQVLPSQKTWVLIPSLAVVQPWANQSQSLGFLLWRVGWIVLALFTFLGFVMTRASVCPERYH